MELIAKSNREKIRNAIACASYYMDTPYFAIILGILTLISYFLGLDLLIIISISICISFAFLAKKNLNCLLVIFFYMASMISFKNSPASSASSEFNNFYYFNPNVYITCIIATSIPVASALYRMIKNILEKKISFDLFTVSILLLAVSFALNGLLIDEYNFKNLLFGIFMVFFFCILFLAISPNVEISKDSIFTISRQLVIYAFVPIIEFISFYLFFSKMGTYVNNRFDIFLGWGNRNTVGFLMSISLCFQLFLCLYEPNKIFKGFCHLIGTLTVIVILFSFSRQTYLSIILLIMFLLLVLIFKAKGRAKTKSIIYFSICSLAGISVILFVILSNRLYLNTESLNIFSTGRLSLWNAAFDSFLKNPIFGGGFYLFGGDPEVQLDAIMPYCCHNTLLQMLGSCGAIGLLSYLTYRILSTIKIYKNFTKEKIWPILSLSMILIMSLFDIHIFDLFGTAIYVVIFSMCLSNTKREEENEKHVIC